MQNGHQIITDKMKENNLYTKSTQSPSSRIFDDVTSDMGSYEPNTKPWASDNCRCADR